MKAIKSCIVEMYQIAPVHGVSQLYIKNKDYGKIRLIVAKVSKDSLKSGSILNMMNFVDAVKKRFTIRKAIIVSEPSFSGANFQQTTSDAVTILMNKCLALIRPIEIFKYRKG